MEQHEDGVYCIPNSPVIRTTVSSTVRPLTIVTATAGALLLILLIVISLVAYQRRRIALAHRQQARAVASEGLGETNDRFSFVYYTNDIHVVLPSYDEAVGTGAPPPYASDSASGSTENVSVVAQEALVDSEPEDEPLYEVIDEAIHLATSSSAATASTSEGVAEDNNVLHKELDTAPEEDVDNVLSSNVGDPLCDDTAPLVDDDN